MRNIFHPEIFQGNIKKAQKGISYFEGWYFKLVSADLGTVISFIPGASFGSDPHCFIQMINGLTTETMYSKFPLSQFTFNTRKMEISIDGNEFSKKGLKLSLMNDDYSIQGSLSFTNLVTWEKKFLSPGIMGGFGFLPFMECYHGLISADHTVQGALNINDTFLDFSNGKGYIEKDWGKSFPKAWIWIQSNHFKDSEVSFMLSVAHIPWIGRSFTGFLGYLYIDNHMIPLATWNRDRLDIADADSSGVRLLITRKNGEKIHIHARSTMSGALHAPDRLSMSRIIKESVNAELDLVLDFKNCNKTLISYQAGLEIINSEQL